MPYMIECVGATDYRIYRLHRRVPVWMYNLFPKWRYYVGSSHSKEAAEARIEDHKHYLANRPQTVWFYP